MRLALAVTLLALFAAPLARAEIERDAGAHGCCPERQAPQPAPCQQLAGTACCAETGVPATPSCDAPPPAGLALALPAAASSPATRSLASRAPARRAAGPPLPPLALSCVLLL